MIQIFFLPVVKICEDEAVAAIHLQRVAGAKKCFFRKSDGGRETLEGWSAGMASPP